MEIMLTSLRCLFNNLHTWGNGGKYTSRLAATHKYPLYHFVILWLNEVKLLFLFARITQDMVGQEVLEAQA